ncbi:hypothetical protein BKA66DRAFT_23185 [Pyrenochaeta sp. MPI-SDFR-AT-0127]|nr:hypothetical protein BKA66DRAFT_23185 [Pyrenochaeta sp. MPI-SDFR-AT-0127]
MSQADKAVQSLANRTEGDAPHKTTHSPMSIEDWLTQVNDALPRTIGLRRATAFAPLGQKSSLDPSNRGAPLAYEQKPRSIRHLPFAQQTFEQICEQFRVHGSIVRTLTRSDVPTFVCHSIDMNGAAFVYNCRTPNSWDTDLALSATHYPERGLTYAILYGSSFIVEKAILQRLKSISIEAAHPVLLPGIFAELELTRHIRLVEGSINEVEAKIFELNFQSSNARDDCRTEVERRNEAKRTAWLDLTYLRNSLITWSTQLLKMAEHAGMLNREVYRISEDITPLAKNVSHTGPGHERDETQVEHPTVTTGNGRLARQSHLEANSSRSDSQHIFLHGLSIPPDPSEKPKESEADDDYIDTSLNREDPNAHLKQMEKVGEKIMVRLAAIRDEYDEKIRDCTMRVDGMAMATQWSHSETAVEIALATNQDSKVMRSISLVTMVFLPGTFFATVFSMTFFDWFNEEGKTRVSSYLWIYVIVTVFFTAITIGLWYFFVMSRRAGRSKSDEEKLRVE